MPRKVFFSFHYDDVLKANIVRNSDIVNRQYVGATRFYDKSLWEEVKKQGDLAIKRMINGALEGSSVTCVLIGQQTWSRPWVCYELLKSFERGNGILGIQIHNIGIGNTTVANGLLSPPRASTILTGGLLSPRPARTTLLTGGTDFPIEPNPGPNPFEYLGFIADYKERSLVLYDRISGTWGHNPHFNAMPLRDVRYNLGGKENGNFTDLFSVYSWKSGGGYQNFPTWVEQAAQHANR